MVVVGADEVFVAGADAGGEGGAQGGVFRVVRVAEDSVLLAEEVVQAAGTGEGGGGEEDGGFGAGERGGGGVEDRADVGNEDHGLAATEALGVADEAVKVVAITGFFELTSLEHGTREPSTRGRGRGWRWGGWCIRCDRARGAGRGRRWGTRGRGKV